MEKLTGTSCGFKKLPFTVAQPGMQIDFDQIPANELGFFLLFFTEDLLNEIVKNTNDYATAKLTGVTMKPHSLWSNWREVTLDEMKAYFGVIMNMALNDKPCVKDYFSPEWINSMPFFVDVFPRNRFLQIHWMLNAAPVNPPSAATQKVDKVKNVLSAIQEKCLQYFIPGCNIAIDETTIAFKGRVSCKMYNPQKPTKWGLRVYVLADSYSDYISVFEPYFGSQTTQGLIRPDLPFTSRIVLHLVQKLLQKSGGTGYHLYTDRFYTGYNLALELLKLGVHTTGTIQRLRQGLPQEVKRKLKLKVHEVVAYSIQSENVMTLCWQDKRQILMLSTWHDADVQTVQRRTKGGQTVSIQKPTVIVDYSAKMGAVDRADHLCTSYNFARKTLKWWRKMFFWLLEVCIVNSYILYNLNRQLSNEPTIEHGQYRKNLIIQLVGDVRNKGKRRGRSSTQDKADRLSKKPHFIDQLEDNKAKDCAVCSDRKTPGGRRTTVFYCKTCSRKPGLHPKNALNCIIRL